MAIEEDLKRELLRTVNEELMRRERRKHLVLTIVGAVIALLLMTAYYLMAG